MRPLRRGRTHVQPLRRVETALKVERRAAPRLAHERDALFDALAAIGAIGLERLVVLQGPAAADADIETSAAHHVEHRQLLGEIDRMVQGQEAHAHAKPQCRGAGGHVRRQDLWRRAEPVVVEVMLGDPHGGIAEGFGGQHLGEAGIVDALLAPRLVALHQKEQPEFHSRPPAPAYGDSILMRGLTEVYDMRTLPIFVSELKSPMAAIRRCSASATLPTPSA